MEFEGKNRDMEFLNGEVEGEHSFDDFPSSSSDMHSNDLNCRHAA
jgi:hypothetical protein